MHATTTHSKKRRISTASWLLPCLIAGCSFSVPDEDSVFQTSGAGGTASGGETGSQSIPLSGVGGSGGAIVGTTSKVTNGGSGGGVSSASGGVEHSSTGGVDSSGTIGTSGGAGGARESTAGMSGTENATGIVGGTGTSNGDTGGAPIGSGGIANGTGGAGGNESSNAAAGGTTEGGTGGTANVTAVAGGSGVNTGGAPVASGGAPSTGGAAAIMGGVGSTLTGGGSDGAQVTGGAGATGGSHTGGAATGGTPATGGSTAVQWKLCGTATADSEQNSPRGIHPASDANDGNVTTTRWTAADAALGHYWTIDFGCEQSPEKVLIYWEYPNGNVTEPYGVMVQVSHDGQLFTNLFYVEQAGLILTLDVNALANAASGGTTLSTSGTGGTSGTSSTAEGGSGGADTRASSTGGVDGSGGESATGGAGSGGLDSGRAGGAGSGGVTGSGGSSGFSPWSGSARYVRLEITKLPPLVNGRATWAGFWEAEFFTLHPANACGVSCP